MDWPTPFFPPVDRSARGWRLAVGLAAIAVVLSIENARGAASDGEATRYRIVDGLNVGLPRLNDPPDLETPQAALENFLGSARRGDYDRAARSLNLNAFAPLQQPAAGCRLAREMFELMNQQIWFKWSDVPDRPDGQEEDDRPLSQETPPSSGPQSNFLLYRLFIGERDYEIRMERVKAGGGVPVWVLSGQTVRHIPALYRQFHPSLLERSLPSFWRTRKFAKVALWQWVGFAVMLLASVLFGRVVQKAVDLVPRWFDSPWARASAEAIRGPGSLTIGLIVFYGLARSYLGLAGPILSMLNPFYVAIVCASVVWFLRRLIGLVVARIHRRYAGYDNDEGNIYITRLFVARHLLVTLVVVGGGFYALSGFETVRRFGMTILASASVAGLVLGVAAQRVLGNLFAGLLIGFIQPVKAGDAIIFEDDFGWIEEISITHLVVRTWDLRRLLIPNSYFMDHPFQNWSRGTQQIIKPVMVHADYRVEVERVRDELKSILEATDLWDRSVPPVLQVVDFGPDTIVLRALCSARDPGTSWDLHCLVRERLVDFLRRLEGGRFLPRHRLAFVDEAAASKREAADYEAPGRDDPPAGGARNGEGPGHGAADP